MQLVPEHCTAFSPILLSLFFSQPTYRSISTEGTRPKRSRPENKTESRVNLKAASLTTENVSPGLALYSLFFLEENSFVPMQQ